MKFSTMMAIVAAALCVAGCKYNKINEGEIGATGDAIGADIEGMNDGGMGSIDSLSEGKFEDLYTRCTDVSFSPIYFGFDSTVIAPSELSKIDEVVAHLNSNPSRVTVVEGNCDERGSNEYNMSLGENRAVIIRNYLVQSGISSARIQTRSYGEEKPAIDGHDESAWSKNRRGEFAIFETAK